MLRPSRSVCGLLPEPLQGLTSVGPCSGQGFQSPLPWPVPRAQYQIQDQPSSVENPVSFLFYWLRTWNSWILIITDLDQTWLVPCPTSHHSSKPQAFRSRWARRSCEMLQVCSDLPDLFEVLEVELYSVLGICTFLGIQFIHHAIEE